MKKISENSGRDRINGFEEFSLRRKKRTIWTAAGCVLAALMAVGIGFALRSPGRALEPEKILDCKYSVHHHSDESGDCYTDGVLSCGKAEYVIHHHDKYCYKNQDVTQERVCTLPEPDPEQQAHMEENGCYDETGNFICEGLVVDAHQHDESCLKSVPQEPSEPGTTTGQGDTTTGNQTSGDTGNQGSGNEGNQTSGDTGNQGSGNEGNQTSGDTGNQGSGNEGNQTSGDTGNQGSGNKGDQNLGDTGNQGSENKGDQNSETPEPEWKYTKTFRTYEDAEITIEVTYPLSALIPDEAELVVEKLTGPKYKDALAQAENALKKELDEKFDPGAVVYDISFVYEDKVNGVEYVFEPEYGVMQVTFHFKDRAYEDGDDLTIVHVGEEQGEKKIEINEEVEVKDGKSTIGASSFSPYVLGTTRPVNSQNIQDSVWKVDFYTRQGSIWVSKNKEADGQYHFDSEDNVKARFECKNIQVSKLGSGAYIPLPKSISFPKEMIGKTVVYNDKDYPNAGTYQLLYDTDGSPCAFFGFEDEYLKWVRLNRGGYIQNLFFEFEFTWDVAQTDGKEEQEDIYLGNFKGTVKIKTKDESNNSSQNLGYTAYKNVQKTEYNDKGEMLIRYKIDLNVEKWLDKAIVLSDEITRGTKFYDFEWQFYGNGGTHAKDYVKLSEESDTKKTITIGDDSKGVDTGYYAISYTVYFNVGDLQNAQVDSVKNTITYGDGKYHSSTDTDTKTNSMTKNGTVENVSTGEVTWTVRINDGKTPYTFGEKETFTDTLPKGTSLVDNTMQIIEYDANWDKTGKVITWKAEKNKDNGTTLITADLTKGAYRYEIVYKTKQDEDPKPGVETKVKNEAKISGGLDYEISAEVTMKPEPITKKMEKVLTTSQEFYEPQPNGPKLEVFEIAWSVTLASVKDGEEYTDSGLNANWVAPLLMSDEQIKSIKVKSGGTDLKEGADYIITAPNGNNNFLFKIKFLTTQKNVTIDYTCYADVTNVTDNGFNVRNVFGSAEAGDWIAKVYKSQSTNLFKYVEGTNINEHYFFTNSQIAIGPSDTLHWVIVAEPNCHPNAPLEFTDTLPKGLSFVDTSLKITADGFELAPTDYDYQIDKNTNVITLKVNLAGKTFGDGGWKKYGDTSSDNMKLFKLVIKYDTEITDLAGGEKKSYTNTVKWDNNKVSQNVTVTRDVIGKNGSFDPSNGILSYSVIINRDGADLNPNGNLLRVEDTLTDRKGIEFEFSGMKLYKLTDASDGSGKKVRGEEIELELLQEKPKNDGSERKFTYYYDKESYTFTAFIPDQTGYELVYDYRVLSDVADDNVYVSNKATLYGGSKSYGSTQTSTKVLKFALKTGGNTQDVTDLLVRKVWKDGDGNVITRLNGKLTFDLYRKKVPENQAQTDGYIKGKTFIYELTPDDLKMIEKDYKTFKEAQEEYVGEYILETSNGKWELLIPNLVQMDGTGNIYQYYLVETSMDTLSSGNDELRGVEYAYAVDKDPVEITVTNTIVSDYSLPETGAEGSWIDRIISWFKNVIGI